jgi:hypothetical protein
VAANHPRRSLPSIRAWFQTIESDVAYEWRAAEDYCGGGSRNAIADLTPAHVFAHGASCRFLHGHSLGFGAFTQRGLYIGSQPQGHRQAETVSNRYHYQTSPADVRSRDSEQ